MNKYALYKPLLFSKNFSNTFTFSWHCGVTSKGKDIHMISYSGYSSVPRRQRKSRKACGFKRMPKTPYYSVYYWGLKKSLLLPRTFRVEHRERLFNRHLSWRSGHFQETSWHVRYFVIQSTYYIRSVCIDLTSFF